jgi:hypothetical protein
MKKVSKKLLDLAIENCRKYWDLPLEDGKEYLDEWQKFSIEIGKKNKYKLVFLERTFRKFVVNVWAK